LGRLLGGGRLAVVKADAVGALSVGRVPNIPSSAVVCTERMTPVSDARLGKGLLAGHTNDWSDAVTAYAKHLTGHVEVRPDRLEAIALEEAHVGVEVVEHGSVSGHCKQLRGREATQKSGQVLDNHRLECGKMRAR